MLEKPGLYEISTPARVCLFRFRKKSCFFVCKNNCMITYIIVLAVQVTFVTFLLFIKQSLAKIIFVQCMS